MVVDYCNFFVQLLLILLLIHMDQEAWLMTFLLCTIQFTGLIQEEFINAIPDIRGAWSVIMKLSQKYVYEMWMLL